MAALLMLGGCSGGGQASDKALPPLPLKGTWHKVEAGETVAALAARYRVATADFEEINGMERGQIPAVGDRVFIPGGGVKNKTAGRPVKPQERSTATVTYSGGGTADKGKGEGTSGTAATIKVTGAGLLLWPVPGGKLGSKYGKRAGRPHEGIDIRAPRGTAILAAADGTVMYAGSGVQGYGNMIIVRHAGGLVTVYAHNQRNHVNEGVKVARGQVIGEVGSSGRASGTHLHFEVRRGETPEDPSRHLRP